MKYSKYDLFDDIAKSSLYGNLGLFIGAGMSKAVMNGKSNIRFALSWGELLDECIALFNIKIFDYETKGLSYPDLASLIVKKIAKEYTINFEDALLLFKEKIAELTFWVPTNPQRDLFRPIFEKISPNWIITTNYDLIIESILTGKSFTLGPSDVLTSPNNLIPIYHLHGVRTNPSSIVITQEDYIRLFRPNEYRQQKLPLLLKESTTIFIGYGIGDFNVLTALDWNKNVYPEIKGDNRYPNKIIQFLKSEQPKQDPYDTHNGVTVLEFKDLQDLLTELGDHIAIERRIDEDVQLDNEEYNNLLRDADEEIVQKFVDNYGFREATLSMVKELDYKVINSFLEFFQKVIDESWKRTRPSGAFNAYGHHLNILLDIFNIFKVEKFPPALLDALTYQLNRVAFYVGDHYGESYYALDVWNRRKVELDIDVWEEVERLAKQKSYYEVLGLPNPNIS